MRLTRLHSLGTRPLLTLPSLTQEEVQGIEFSEVLVVNRVVGKVGQVSQHLQLKI